MSTTLPTNERVADFRDPLSALGHSIFLSILHHLPTRAVHTAELVCKSWRSVVLGAKVSIYSRLCKRAGLEHEAGAPVRIAASDKRTANEGSDAKVDWHKLLKDHHTLQAAWNHGRCKDRWISTEEVPVWRFKVDKEEGIAICTSRHEQTSGMIIVDYKTGKGISAFPLIRVWTHVELALGHVVVDTRAGEQTFHVYRTQAAVDRSSHPPPPPSARPEMSYKYVGSMIDPHYEPKEDWAQTGRKLSRGHLSWYRAITPPTECVAFRARVDHKGVPGKERAVLATAGEEGVYLWDLDEPDRVESIPIKPQNQAKIQYVEFDEDYVFVCGVEQLHVYSRQTRLRVLSWPPNNVTLADWIACAFIFDLRLAANQAISALSDDGNPAHVPPGMNGKAAHEDVRTAWLDRMDEEGRWRGDPEIYRDMCGADNAQWEPADGTLETPLPIDYSACHFTKSDLACTARMGTMWIMRDYREVLQQPTEELRCQEAAKRVIWMGMESPTELLATNGDHIMAVTEDSVVLINTAGLPLLPRPHSFAGDRPRLSLHLVISTTSLGVTTSSCAQLDESSMYLNYWAKGEVDGGGAPYEDEGRLLPPEKTLEGLGVVLRAWDFA